jgi:dTMP kinase
LRNFDQSFRFYPDQAVGFSNFAMAQRGVFILFEGVDRCGKTTQARKLVESLTRIGKPSQFFRFPDRETSIGLMINSYLTQSTELDDHVIHLLFSANRWEKLQEIVKLLESGVNVIVDRYAYSGVAFSSSKKNMSMAWCKECDTGLLRPDCIYYMDISAEEAAKRGGFGNERYEATPFQLSVREKFTELMDHDQKIEPNLWKVINAVGSIEEIHEKLLQMSLNIINDVQSQNMPLKTLWNGDVYNSQNAPSSI